MVLRLTPVHPHPNALHNQPPFSQIKRHRNGRCSFAIARPAGLMIILQPPVLVVVCLRQIKMRLDGWRNHKCTPMYGHDLWSVIGKMLINLIYTIGGCVYVCVLLVTTVNGCHYKMTIAPRELMVGGCRQQINNYI